MAAFFQIGFILGGVLVCSVRAVPADIPALTTCGHAKAFFEAKNLTGPQAPVNGNTLTVCKADHSCCTSEMESSLMTLVKKEYHSLLQYNAHSVQGILASTAIHFQDYVHQMMLKVENKTLRLFHDVFGTNAAVTDEAVKTFFTDLNNHLNNRTSAEKMNKVQEWKNADAGQLAHITSSFFVRVFPYMYQTTLNENQRELDPEYKECLRSRMADIFPSMSPIRMLEKDISKTFGATKVLIMSLDFGSQVLNSTNLQTLSEASFNAPQCYESLLKLTYCSHCDGHAATVKPCSGYCLNVMRGCLAQQSAELDMFWSAFYEAVDKLISLVNRGQSLVCLEDLLKALHSRIAEPMLMLSEQSEYIHNKAKYTCGQAKWVNGTKNGNGNGDQHKEALGVVPGITLTKLPGGHPDWSMDEDDFNFRSNLLTRKITQFKESVPQSKAFYANLADMFCADDSFAETKESAPCWNGQRVAEYTKTVLPIQIISQKYNPELPLTSQITTDPKITDMVERLRQMTQIVQNHMVSNPESDSLYQMANDDGSGSGSGPINPGDWSDDEDAESDWHDQGSGSGDVPQSTDFPEGENIGIQVRTGLVDVGQTFNKTYGADKPTGSGVIFKSSSSLLAAICILSCWRSIL